MPIKNVVPQVIRDFIGVNTRDDGERVQDNQFLRIQNMYFASKGTLTKRLGSTPDLLASQIPGCNRISGIHRHYSPNREKYTIYHCEPTSSALPDNTTDLVLSEIAGGQCFSTTTVQRLRFCYSWIGLGQEQTYNSKSRANFVSTANTNAWNQLGHQWIDVSSSTKGVRVQVPAFPAGVRGANVFVQRGNPADADKTEMTYVGTVGVSNGTLDVTSYVGPSAANADSFGPLVVGKVSGGPGLKPGTYFVSLAWLTDPAMPESDSPIGTLFPTQLGAATAVVLTGDQVGFTVTHDMSLMTSGHSTNGARACYVFVGTQSDRLAPMVCVGIVRSGDTLSVTSIPDNTNAQSHPDLSAADTSPAQFVQAAVSSNAVSTSRLGFLVKKDGSGSVTEIFPSRSIKFLGVLNQTNPIAGGATGEQFFYLGYPKTNNDTFGDFPHNWGRTIYDPEFCYFNGLSYFVNGIDMPWQTDGKSLGQLTHVSGTTLPPYPRFLAVFQNSLIAAGAEAKNQLFACNAINAQNWATGGTGAAKRYISIGDNFGDEVTAVGVFSHATDAVNDPRSFIVAFKKHGAWMKDSFPDPSGSVGSPMSTLSGRVGCIAYRSVVSTPIGLLFLGSDGIVYMIRSAGDPIPIGTLVQSFFSHLVNNDSLMSKVTACYHNNHYKISYPSSATSTTNDAEFWADLRTEGGSPVTWVGPHTGMQIGPQMVFVGESDDMSRVCALASGAGSAVLEDPTTYQDLGVSVVASVTSKLYKCKSEMHMKRFLSLMMDALWDDSYSQSVNLEAFIDEQYALENRVLSTGPATYDGSSVYGGGASFGGAFDRTIEWFFGVTNLVGRMFQFRVTHSDNAPFTIKAFGFLYKPERRMIK